MDIRTAEIVVEAIKEVERKGLGEVRIAVKKGQVYKVSVNKDTIIDI